MDQQFRLKWNNHCNTLLQVFGNLLKTETLVDCTIGADGQYLKAHKVVVSACSPYFQSLFTEHFDKHPIIILKDIKFAELQSMIDYMYEGEVNISQDQLPSFLKAAASIQLKGLTQNVKSEAPPPPQSPPSSKPPLPQLNSARGGMLSNGSLTPSSMLNVELEEGQQRKKRKLGATGTEPSSASSSPSLVPDLVTPSVILDVPGENTGAGATVGQNGQGGGGGQSGDGGLMKKEPSEYSGRSEDEEEDGMSHDGWDLSNDGLHDSNSTMSAGDRTGQGPGGLHHNTPAGGMRPAGGPGGLSAAGGPDMSNVDENNQEDEYKSDPFKDRSYANGNHCTDRENRLNANNLYQLFLEQQLQQQFTGGGSSLGVHQKVKSSALPVASGDENVKRDYNDTAMAISQRYLEKIAQNPLQSIAAAQLAHAQNILLQDYYESGSDTSETNVNHSRRQRRSKTHGDKEDGMILPCDGCGKKYRSKTSLSLHKRLECGKEPAFKCPHCPLKTHQKGNLQVHMKKKHNQDCYTGVLNLSPASAIFNNGTMGGANENALNVGPPKISSSS